MSSSRSKACGVEFPCGATRQGVSTREFAERQRRGLLPLVVFREGKKSDTIQVPTFPDGSMAPCLEACPSPSRRKVGTFGRTADRAVECSCEARSPSAELVKALEDELDALRDAMGALSGAAQDVLDHVTPEAMRFVLAARGWVFRSTLPWPGDPTILAFEVYIHDGEDMSKGRRKVTRVPLVTDSDDWRERVVDCVVAAADRCGNHPAELLARMIVEAGKS